MPLRNPLGTPLIKGKLQVEDLVTCQVARQQGGGSPCYCKHLYYILGIP